MDLNKNTNLLVLGIGVIVFMPVIKGLIDALKLLGGALSLPGDLIKKIGDSAVRQVHDVSYQAILNYVSYHIYDENNPNDQLDLKRLKEDFNFTAQEQNNLITIWKDHSVPKIVRMSAHRTAYLIEKEKLVGFLRKLLP